MYTVLLAMNARTSGVISASAFLVARRIFILFVVPRTALRLEMIHQSLQKLKHASIYALHWHHYGSSPTSQTTATTGLQYSHHHTFKTVAERCNSLLEALLYICRLLHLL